SISRCLSLITSHHSLLKVPCWRRGLLLIPFVLVCLALSPMVRAVLPAPDGGYAGQNTAEGTDALFSLTTGSSNTALGFSALNSDTTGGDNTATGAAALSQNSTGSYNTATGAYSLWVNTIGDSNTANGWAALNHNTTGP